MMKIRVLAVWGMILYAACAPKPGLDIDFKKDVRKSLYRLGYGDVIEVKFFDNQQFNREVMVRPDGRITLEKIGDIYVEGLTPSEIDSVITLQYRKILKTPDVTIFVKQFGNQKVYVTGEVNAPGGFQLERDMSVAHAITLARGVKRSGNINSVLIIRKSADGKVRAKRVDLSRLFSVKEDAEDYSVQALDIVYVPKTFIANVDVFVDQFFNLILPPVDVFWRLWFIEQMNSD